MSSDSYSNPSSKGKSHAKKNPTLRGTRLSRQLFKDNSSLRSSHKGEGSFLGHLTSIRPWEESTSYRSSDLYPSQRKPIVQYENTYKLAPECSFLPKKVEGVISSVLEEELKDMTYEGQEMGSLSRSLADIIKERVKALNLPRYKIISWVMICERQKNSMRVASRGLWDTEYDNYACSVYENNTLHATGMVYALYQD